MAQAEHLRVKELQQQERLLRGRLRNLEQLAHPPLVVTGPPVDLEALKQQLAQQPMVFLPQEPTPPPEESQVQEEIFRRIGLPTGPSMPPSSAG